MAIKIKIRLRCNRLQSLIAVHTYRMKLDLPDSSSFDWLQQYRPVVQQYFKHISIHIKLIKELLKMMPVIDALTVAYDERTQRLVVHFSSLNTK